jgi:hypothetical protein
MTANPPEGIYLSLLSSISSGRHEGAQNNLSHLSHSSPLSHFGVLRWSGESLGREGKRSLPESG